MRGFCGWFSAYLFVYLHGIFRSILIHAIPLLNVDHSGPVMASVGSEIKLACSASQWTDGYTITWSKNTSGEVLSKNLHVVADPTKFSVTTVTSSELESTRWTLTIKDASQSDSGDYTCSLKTEPPQFVTVTVIVQIPLSSELPPEAVRWDVSDCCSARNLPAECMPLCNTISPTVTPGAGSMDILRALRTSDRCRQYHDTWFRCLANDRNHSPCCRRRHVPDKCLDLCVGNFSTVFKGGGLDCLHFVAVIFRCFHDGRESIPSVPRSLRLALIGSDSMRVSWSPPLKHAREVNYTVIYKALGYSDPGLRRAGGLTKAMSTNALGLIISNLVPGESYKVHVVALNAAGSSLPSDAVIMEVPSPPSQPTRASSTAQKLQSQTSNNLLQNTTMASIATQEPTLSRPKFDQLTSLSTTTTFPPLTEMALLQPNDDLLVFDRCFGSDEFRMSCSEIYSSSLGNAKNTTIVRCRDSLPRFLGCAADGADHGKCCLRNAVPNKCLNPCVGKPSGIFDLCHVFLPRVLTCFREGSLFLSSEPTGITAELRDNQIVIQWLAPELRSEMIEHYIITIEDRKRPEPYNISVPRDVHTVTLDPPPTDSEFAVFIQSENFHGLSRRSATVLIQPGETSQNTLEHTAQQAASGSGSSSAGPGVAIGISLGGIVLVIIVVVATYCLKRVRQLPSSTTSSSEEHLGTEDKMHKPINAFYIPGYFGKSKVSRQKTGSNSSVSYATSFSLRRPSNASEPVYSDVSGAYLWMFGHDKKGLGGVNSHSSHPTCSRKPSENIYDNNIPLRTD